MTLRYADIPRIAISCWSNERCIFTWDQNCGLSPDQCNWCPIHGWKCFKCFDLESGWQWFQASQVMNAECMPYIWVSRMLAISAFCWSMRCVIRSQVKLAGLQCWFRPDDLTDGQGMEGIDWLIWVLWKRVGRWCVDAYKLMVRNLHSCIKPSIHSVDYTRKSFS